jgi:hypothetical protein
MAGSKEVALGVASVLASPNAPDPFPLSFCGQTLSDAADIVLAIIRECEDAGSPIGRIEMDPDLFEEVKPRTGAEPPITSNASLVREGRFYKA